MRGRKTKREVGGRERKLVEGVRWRGMGDGEGERQKRRETDRGRERDWEREGGWEQ